MKREKRDKKKTNKEELLQILSAVKPGLSQKDIVEQSSHFIFTGEEIITYNDQICISYPFKTDFKCSVDANNLYKLLSGVPGNEVEMKFEGNQLRVVGSKFKAGLAVSIEDTIYELFSDIRVGFKRGWKVLPSDFLEGLFLCMFSASTDMTIRELTGVVIRDDIIVSSDDLRISKYKMEKGIGRNCSIPARAVFELRGYDFTEYKVGDSWIHFRTDEGVVFSIRLLEGKADFEFDQYFEVEGKELTLPDKLSSVLDTVSIMADGDFDFEKRIEVIVDGDKLVCRGQKDQGWVEMEEKSEEEGEEKLSFFINPIFLKQILQKTNIMIVGEGRALFRSEKFEHVMLLSIGNE